VIALTDGSGAIAERYAYSAYGEPVFTNAAGTVLAESAKDNRYTYTGREWDEELSLYHFRARMYDAGSGRFCGRDEAPLPHNVLFLYSYVMARPYYFVDPFGLDAVVPFAPGISVVSSNVQPCFDVDIGFKFQIPQGLQRLSGFVIQEIHQVVHIEDCDGKDITSNYGNTAEVRFWEAFSLEAIWTRSRVPDPDDSFQVSLGADGTRGTLTVTGTAKGAANWQLPSHFIDPPPPGAPSNKLPFSPTEPANWNMIPGTPHNMTVTWDCCCDKKNLNVQTVPSWSMNWNFNFEDPLRPVDPAWPIQWPIHNLY
jgi:RHS repeat-associated protein